MSISLPEAVLRRLFERLKSVTTLTCFMSVSVNLDKVFIDVMAGNLTNLESLTILTPELLKGEDVNGMVGLSHLKSLTLRRRVIENPSWKHLEKFAVEIVERLRIVRYW